MGCGSCGQRYRGRVPVSSAASIARRQQLAERRAALRNQGVTVAPDETSRVVRVQPDTPAGVVIPNPEVAVEPATGIPISVIKGGEDPTKSLGETKVPPISIADGLGQGEG